MIFSDIYPRPVAEMILDGTKCQTRRLVKKGDYYREAGGLEINELLKRTVMYILPTVDRGDKLHWQVGRDLSVQLGRGKAGLWYCLKCKEIAECKDYFTSFGKHKCKVGYKSLRIKITGIKKERLLDISEEDAKKEGFGGGEYPAKMLFLTAFCKVCKIDYNREAKRKGKDIVCSTVPKKNPEVWVLDFSVMK